MTLIQLAHRLIKDYPNIYDLVKSNNYSYLYLPEYEIIEKRFHYMLVSTFLHENNINEKLIIEYTNKYNDFSHKYNNIYEIICDYHYVTIKDFFYYWFYFGQTPQGFAYWMQIYYKWKNYITNVKNSTNFFFIIKLLT